MPSPKLRASTDPRASIDPGMVWDGGVSIGNFTPTGKAPPRASVGSQRDLGVDPRLSSILIPRDQILARQHIDPEEMFLRRLAGQVDFLFSDANLWIDTDMKNEISANEQGWVSLSFIARLPRVAVLTREREVLLTALKFSWFLEIDSKGLMIRRPEKYAYNPESNPRRHAKKSMYVDSLPDELCNEESVRKLFDMFGTISSITKCQPWMPLDQQDSSTAREWSLANSDMRNRRREAAFFVDFEKKNNAKSAVTAVSVFNRKLQEGRIDSRFSVMGENETSISIRPFRGRIDSLASEYIGTPSMSPIFASMSPGLMAAQSPLILQHGHMGHVPSLSLTSIPRAHDSPKKDTKVRISPKSPVLTVLGDASPPSSVLSGDNASPTSDASASSGPGAGGAKSHSPTSAGFRLSACSPVFTPAADRGSAQLEEADAEFENLPPDFEGLYVMTKFSYMKRMERMYVPGAPGQSPSFGPRDSTRKSSMSPSLIALGSTQAHREHQSKSAGATPRQSPKLVALPLPATQSPNPNSSKRNSEKGRRSRSGSMANKDNNNNPNSPEGGGRQRSDSKTRRERSDSKSDKEGSGSPARSDCRDWRNSPALGAMHPSPSGGPSTPALKLTSAALPPSGKPPRSGGKKKKRQDDDGPSSPEGGSSPPGGGSALGILRSMRKHSKSFDSDDGNGTPNDKNDRRSSSGKKSNKGRRSRSNTPSQSPKLGPTDPSAVRPKRASQLERSSLRFSKGPLENSKGFGGFGRGKPIQ